MKQIRCPVIQCLNVFSEGKLIIKVSYCKFCMYIFCTRMYWVHYPYWLTKQISCKIIIFFSESEIIHGNTFLIFIGIKYYTCQYMAKLIVKHFLPLFKCSNKAVLPVYSEDRYKLYNAYILYAVFVWKKKKSFNNVIFI